MGRHASPSRLRNADHPATPQPARLHQRRNGVTSRSLARGGRLRAYGRESRGSASNDTARGRLPPGPFCSPSSSAAAQATRKERDGVALPLAIVQAKAKAQKKPCPRAGHGAPVGRFSSNDPVSLFTLRWSGSGPLRPANLQCFSASVPVTFGARKTFRRSASGFSLYPLALLPSPPMSSPSRGVSPGRRIGAWWPNIWRGGASRA